MPAQSALEPGEGELRATLLRSRVCLTFALAASALASTADFFFTLHSAGNVGASDALFLWMYLTVLWGFVAFPLAVFLFSFRRMTEQLISQHPDGKALLVQCATNGISLALLCLAVYAAVVVTVGRFHNTELYASLMAGFCALAVFGFLRLRLCLARIGTMLHARHCDRLGRTWSFLCIGFALAVLAFIWKQNRDGLAQLEIGLKVVIGVLVAASAASIFFSPRLSQRAVGRMLHAMVAVFIASAIGAAVAEKTNSPCLSLVSHDAPVGEKLADLFQRLTDVDDDGASSFLGGGDCAPWDSRIGPYAREIPSDGLDNNCLGGDQTTSWKPSPPEWSKLRSDWPDLNVVVVTIEALRYDHVGYMGYERATSKTLDALAKRSIVFENFYPAGTLTRVSLPAFFASSYPTRLHWVRNTPKQYPTLHPSNGWMPEAFAKSGFRTAAILPGYDAFLVKKDWNISRGFSTYDTSTALKYRGGTMLGFPSAGLIDKALSWLSSAESDKRFFLWTHLLEPHFKYEQAPGAPVFGNKDIDKYDAEIWKVDEAIRKLLDYLESTHLMDKTIVLVMGDHGEDMGEHDKRFHGYSAWNTSTRTTAVLWVPGVKPARIADPISAIDLGPTISNLAKVAYGFDRQQGRNLTATLLSGAPVEKRPLLVEKWNLQERRYYLGALIDWPYKLISMERTGSSLSLYNLKSDPLEKRDLSQTEPLVFNHMKETLLGFFEQTQLP